MSPDFWGLAAGLVSRETAHGRMGILIDPPMALVLTWVFCTFLEARLSFLPGLKPLDREHPFHFPMAALGAWIGCGTHLLWDQFTHQGSRILSDPYFARVLIHTHGVDFTVASMIWFANSAFGAGAIGWWIHRGMRRTGARFRDFVSKPWLAMLSGLVVPALVFMFWFHEDSLSGEGGLRRALYSPHAVKSLLVVSLVLALVAGWISIDPKRRSRSE